MLQSRLDDDERVWLEIRIPGRPNGGTGWVREEQLSAPRVVETHLTINRRTLTATLEKRGKKIWTSRVGVGAPGTVTPKGTFWIRERLRNLGGTPIYGPWAFGTSAYSDTLTDWPGGGVVGIHGTNQPELIPGRPSHGCVRVPNDKISRLAKLMPVGHADHDPMSVVRRPSRATSAAPSSQRSRLRGRVTARALTGARRRRRSTVLRHATARGDPRVRRRQRLAEWRRLRRTAATHDHGGRGSAATGARVDGRKLRSP